MIKVGFIGLGTMGAMQADAFAKVSACKVVAGADLSPANLAAFKSRFPHAAAYADHPALLKDKQVDAVVVSVPTGLHREVATDVMRSGRPLLLEKPAARTVGECRRLLDEAGRTNRLCMIAHCRRFDPDWGLVAKIVTGGAIGRPVLWRDVATVGGPGGWFMDDRMGGGPLIDGCVHNYDFANFMFGEPVQVVGSGIQLTRHSAVDTATAVVHYAGGDQLMVCWSWCGIPAGTRVREIQGDKGLLTFGAGPLATPKLDAKARFFHCLTRPGKEGRKLYSVPRKDMYVEQARHFVQCVAGKAQCRSPLSEAIKAVAVAEAVLKVARKPGATPVRW